MLAVEQEAGNWEPDVNFSLFQAPPAGSSAFHSAHKESLFRFASFLGLKSEDSEPQEHAHEFSDPTTSSYNELSPSSSRPLEGRRILVTGAVTTSSISATVHLHLPWDSATIFAIFLRQLP
jgi:hypothetical protein